MAGEAWEPVEPGSTIVKGPPARSQKQIVRDIDGTEIPTIGSFSKSVSAHIKKLGLTGHAKRERYYTIVRVNAGTELLRRFLEWLRTEKGFFVGEISRTRKNENLPPAFANEQLIVEFLNSAGQRAVERSRS